jgi:hypothetical protein
MRTGPFSSREVIDRLNAFFVPVYVVNEDYREHGNSPKEEKALVRRIYTEALGKKLSTGTVHVYVLSPKGEVIDTRHVADAAKTRELVAFLDGITARLGTPRGEPVVAPKPQSRPPASVPGSLVLHLVARPLDGRGSWPGTAEDWVVYTPDEVKRLLSAGKAAPGASWEPDPVLMRRLFLHVYPVTENNDPAKNDIKQQVCRITVLSVSGEVVRARIDARLVMRHDFYHKPDGKTVDARLVGYVEWSAVDGGVKTLRLVTDGATYGGGTFAAAVRSE